MHLILCYIYIADFNHDPLIRDSNGTVHHYKYSERQLCRSLQTSLGRGPALDVM